MFQCDIKVTHRPPPCDAYHDAMIWSVFLLAPPLEVLLTTPGTLALHKPAGLATQRRIDTESSLIGQVRRELSNPDAELPHRLDAIAGAS